MKNIIKTRNGYGIHYKCNGCGEDAYCPLSYFKRRKIHYCSRKCFRKYYGGSAVGNWKGDAVGYRALHSWIIRNYGKAKKCENKACSNKKAKRFYWANISKRYKRDRKDFIQLCMSCHQKWDRGLIKIIT